MKKLVLMLLLGAAVTLVPAAAQAGPMTGDQVTVTGGGTVGGGPFWIEPFDFQTFCLEKDEYIIPGGTYYVKIADEAYAGGINTDAGDPLDPKTAFLYRQFIDGNLVAPDLQGLQLAIWFLEEEIGADYGGLGSPANRAAADAFLVLAANATGLYGVQVMQLWTYCDAEGNCRGEKQDMLTVPDGGMTLMLLGGALFGLGALRRKIR